MSDADHRRARILLEAGTNELEVIAFSLCYRQGGERVQTTYGINAGKVRELVAMPGEVTAVPGAGHPCVLGVFMLRNRTITLVDLARWFDYEPVTDDEVLRCWTVIVTEINGKYFGFVTHGVDKVHRVSWTEVMAPPPLVAQANSITGICLIDDAIIQMVDFENIVAAIDPSMRMTAEGRDREALEGGEGATIVVADDSGMILTTIRRNLEEAGYKVVAFRDGLQAWEYLEKYRHGMTSDGEVAAVITDIEMPRMDGHHLCARIKEDGELKRLPVILFSSMINDALRRKGQEVGADDQITKPEIGQLLDRLHACIAAASAKAA